MKIDFPRVIQELAVNLQQPLRDPVEDACRISWNEVDMQLYLHEEEGQWLVIATLDLAEIPVGADPHIHKLMLQANYLWIASDYATLSLNPETNMVCLCDKLNAELVDAEILTARVKQLYQTALYWQGIIANESLNVKPQNNAKVVQFGDNLGIKV